MIQPSCVSLTELDLCHQPAFPNIFYHTMQSYVLQAFEIVATTAAERRLRTARPRQGLNIEKRAIHRMTLFSISLRARDVAERPGDVRLRRPEQRGDIPTVRTRQGSNIQKRRYPTDISFFVSLRARDGIRTRDPRLGKAILHH